MSGWRQQPRPGDVFGRLTVAEAKGRNKHRKPLFLCLCECGGEKVTTAQRLLDGQTRSCGCLVRENATKLKFKHGHAAVGCKTPTWRTWEGMLGRCTYPGMTSWGDYGGRGITVCEGWRSFESFLEDMGPKPGWATGGIDRVDGSGNYSCGHCSDCLAHGWPMNCRWATKKQQRENQRPPKRSVAPPPEEV